MWLHDTHTPTGIVQDIIDDDDNDCNDAPGVPACVIVDFGKSYTGPSCFEEGDEVVTAGGCVPIFPRTEQWETVDGGGKDKKTTHSRYAWTLFGKPRDKPSRRRSS